MAVRERGRRMAILACLPVYVASRKTAANIKAHQMDPATAQKTLFPWYNGCVAECVRLASGKINNLIHRFSSFRYIANIYECHRKTPALQITPKP